VKIDGGIDRQEGAGITRPRPIEFSEEALVEAVRDRYRMEVLLTIGPRPEKGAALRRHQPFMAIADIPVDAHGWQIEPDLPWSMRAVDEH
jgi:hypothetical protein